MSQRRALVTGATGGLGLALCSALAETGYAVRATGRRAALADRLKALGAEFVSADLLSADLRALCANTDVVFHAAALSSPWGPREIFQRINVHATAALLAAARQAGAGAFVFVSSPSIYAALKDQRNLTEDSSLPARFLNAYAATKHAAEQLVLAANALGFRTMSIRPRAIIGPDDAVLLPRVMALGARGRFPIFRDGRALIELTDVRDAARAVVAADTHRETAAGLAINISGGRSIPVIDLARRLGEAIGRPLRLQRIPMPVALAAARATETMSALLPGRPEPALTTYGLATLAYTQTFDLSRARRMLGYQPRHDAVETAAALAAKWRRAA